MVLVDDPSTTSTDLSNASFLLAGRACMSWKIAHHIIDDSDRLGNSACLEPHRRHAGNHFFGGDISASVMVELDPLYFPCAIGDRSGSLEDCIGSQRR